jgi:5'-deoxynucleotidase YfbR-like HD superfamily hydrolase
VSSAPQPAPENRVGDWIQTYTGKKMWPLDPREDEICIEDIAHGLSNICRFGGQCLYFYSVAEHCVRGSHAIHPVFAFEFLMHDSTEPYLGDMVRPLKRMSDLGDLFTQYENKLWKVIAKKFDLMPNMAAEVEKMDRIMLATERRDIMLHTGFDWSSHAHGVSRDLVPLEQRIVPWSPLSAERAFLRRFKELENRGISIR